MKQKYKYFFFIFIVISVALIALLAYRHFLHVNIPPALLTGAKGIGARIDNVHYTSAKEGRVVWVLDAKSAIRYKGDGLTGLDTVRLVFHTQNKTQYILTSKEAMYNEATGEIDASGDVVVASAEAGYTLKTARLKYSSRTAMITSNDRVEITTKGMRVVGDGLLIDANQETLKLHKDVKAVFTGSSI